MRRDDGLSTNREGRSGDDRKESREYRTDQQGKGREEGDQGMQGAAWGGRDGGEGEVKRGKAEERILTL